MCIEASSTWDTSGSLVEHLYLQDRQAFLYHPPSRLNVVYLTSTHEVLTFVKQGSVHGALDIIMWTVA